MLKRLLIALFAFLAPISAAAQDVAGTWDFRVDDTTIFRFEIEEGDSGEWSGTWLRPDRFASDGNRFAALQGPVDRVTSSAGYEFLGSVELSFDDPRPGAVPDIFRFSQIADDRLEMIYVGTDLEPYTLVRARDGDPMGDWDRDAVFRRPLASEKDEEEEISVREPEPAEEATAAPLWRLRPSGEQSFEAGNTPPANDPLADEGEGAGDVDEVPVVGAPDTDGGDDTSRIDDDFLEDF